MKLIIDIDEKTYEVLKCNKQIIESEDIAVTNGIKAQRAILHGTPIPDNATNGDIMKIIFPQDKLIDDIKVGDEVIVQVDRIGFVTGFDVLFDRVYVTTKDGWSDAFGRSFVKKTGRHFDEIENVLEQMRKG